MPASDIGSAIHRLRRAALLDGGAGLTDGQLLDRFVVGRDAAAIEALVRRHGPMVWGTVRRVLRNLHDAENAFQATFLVLVRKAASVMPREMVANWLYGVARQTALKARATTAKRQGRERQVERMPEPDVTEQDRWDDVVPLLDQELGRLPDKYRVVTVLCDLEGKTRREAARQLGLPEGTVGSRLARARAMLANRLARRGVVLSGGVLAAVLSQQVASAGVPASVVSSTICATSFFAAGEVVTAGVIFPEVAALTEGMMKAMLFTRLKAGLAVVLVLGFVATGATILTCRTAAGQDDKGPAAERPVEPAAEQEKEAFTVWGKEVGGLQAGLGFHPGQKRAYRHGETVTLVARVHNVSKGEVTFHYARQFFIEKPPAVTDDKGKPVPPLARIVAFGDYGIHIPVEVNLAPGEGIELYELKLELRSGNSVTLDSVSPDRLWASGKVRIQYERLASPDIDEILGKLTTGKLELEIKSDPPPAATGKK